MPPVFGRDTPSPHPYDAAITGWLYDADIEFHAMARNIMCDHRVSETREQDFDNVTGHPRTPNGLQHAIVDYHHEYVQTMRIPRFADWDVNSSNILDYPLPGMHLIDRDRLFVRVLDLSGMYGVYRDGQLSGSPAFSTLPKAISDAALLDWLDFQLESRPTEHVRWFIGHVLDAMDHLRLTTAFQPTWAANWSEFAQYADKGPDRWAQAMGLKKPSVPRWLILLRYRAREAGTISRPTQLDAGWYAHHFPSPPQAPLATGGHPMDLRTSPGATALLSEYIHEETTHTLAHWDAAGSLVGRTSGAAGGRLEDQRLMHHRLLNLIYGYNVTRWMPDCV